MADVRGVVDVEDRRSYIKGLGHLRYLRL
jgi:hypothetical protein